MIELRIGSTLQNGKYEITKVLGSGNFGITYLATTKIAVNGQLGQMDVAVNMAIKEFYMNDLNNRASDGSTVEGTQNTMVKNYRKKFKKEAENLAKLHHPNIVKVFEVFDENNTTYYVMEYVEGGSLDEYIKSKGRLTEEEALRCTLEIADALSYMHMNMMIHLDLKPKNIMRNTKGHLFLIDFGLSKQYDENGEPESSTSIGLGTPGYAPLEQASYKQDGTLPVTIDIYALGASLYKMLTGKTPPESSYILNEGFPSLTLKQAGVSSEVIVLVKKAMASMKKDRFQSIDFMSKAFEESIKEDSQLSTINGHKNIVYEEEQTSYEETPVCETKTNNDFMPNGIVINKGKYTIKKAVGSGGFSNVYLAVANEIPSKHVAIKEFYLRKICHRGANGKNVLVESEKGKELFAMYIQKFESEAYRLQQLQHPNIISVTDVFDQNGTSYYVMDFFHGDTLSHILSQTGMPLKENQIRLVLYQILDALEYIHSRNVYHLDISPQNIMMDKDGNIKLIDFGRSKQYNIDGESTTNTSPDGCTPMYSPEEQINMYGNNIGPWTDFYALGATLYKLSTNNQPPSFTDIINDGEHAFKGLKNVAPIIYRTILWMMSPQINQRPQSVSEIKDSLAPTHIPIEKEDKNVAKENLAVLNSSSPLLYRLFFGHKKDMNKRHSFVNLFLMIIMIISLLIFIYFVYWLIPNYQVTYFYEFWWGIMSLGIFIGNGMVLNNKKKGFYLLASFSILSIADGLIDNLSYKDFYRYFFFDVFVINLVFILVYYLVIKISYKGLSVWNMCK